MRQKNKIGIFICTLILSISVLADDCPKTENDFVDWYKKQVTTMDTPKAHRTDVVQRDIVATYRKAEECAGKLEGGVTPLVTKCMAPVKTLLPAMAPDDVGIRRKDGKPETAAPLVLPRAFVDESLKKTVANINSTQEEMNEKIQQLAAKLPANAKIMQFTSATAKIQQSPGKYVGVRSVVTVLPSEKEDVYVHTHVGHEGYLAIRVNKKNSAGKEINPPKVDFFVVDGVTLNAKVDKENRCVSCHRSGSIAVLPENGIFISHTKGMNGQEIEKWWNTNRAITMDRSEYNYDHLGPAIGPSMEAGRTPEFMKQCASKEVPGITPERIEVIRNNMDCTSCHETGRGETLMFPMHTWDFHTTILDNVILKGHMPMGSDEKSSSTYMTDPERKALLGCLKAEFFGGFGDAFYSQGNSKPGILLKYLVPSDCTKQSGANTSTVPAKSAN